MAGEKVSIPARKKPSGYIDLNLRIKDDGGPMFAFLQSIEDPYARGDRVRQLLYLGILAERGMVGGGMPPASVMPQVGAAIPSPPSRKAEAVVKPQATEASGATAGEALQFEADDLSAIFGSPSAAPNLGA